jgi:hypothetical protein
MISNPEMYKSRYDLYHKFAAELLRHDVVLITVEVAFGDRHFEVTQAGNPNHVQLRTWDILWAKENALNIGISRLPESAQYIGWIDSDIQFVNMDWVQAGIHALQKYMIIQPWSECIDKGPAGQAMEQHTSFCSLYIKKGRAAVLAGESGAYYGTVGSTFGHPGYAWLARREALDMIGGLPDWAILGAADHHLALALIGSVGRSNPGGLHTEYTRRLLQLENLCESKIKRDIGYVPGVILHDWHGSKKSRRYKERWKILQDHNFDPATDIVKDTQGLYQLNANKIGLRDDLRAYFAARDEDGTNID